MEQYPARASSFDFLKIGEKIGQKSIDILESYAIFVLRAANLNQNEAR